MIITMHSSFLRGNEEERKRERERERGRKSLSLLFFCSFVCWSNPSSSFLIRLMHGFLSQIVSPCSCDQSRVTRDSSSSFFLLSFPFFFLLFFFLFSFFLFRLSLFLLSPSVFLLSLVLFCCRLSHLKNPINVIDGRKKLRCCRCCRHNF